MKKALLKATFLLPIMLASAHAETVLAKYCPPVNNVEYYPLDTRLYYMEARNEEDKTFSSSLIHGDCAIVGLCKPLGIAKLHSLNFELTQYIIPLKKLICTYNATKVTEENEEIAVKVNLINTGDYQ